MADWPIYTPTSQSKPLDAILSGIGRGTIYTVADADDRDALLAALSDAGLPAPAADNPVYVHRQDAPARYELEVNQGAGWRPVNTGPFAMAAGSVEIAVSGNSLGFVPVVFPPGRFTVPPLVVATCALSAWFAYAYEVTASGFNLGARYFRDTSTTANVTLSWHAIQMAADNPGG